MGVIAWVILGLAAGVVAKLPILGKNREGIIIITLIGVAGALVGGFLATELFHVSGIQGFFNLSTWVTAVAGAGVLLFAYNMASGHDSGRRADPWAGHR